LIIVDGVQSSINEARLLSENLRIKEVFERDFQDFLDLPFIPMIWCAFLQVSYIWNNQKGTADRADVIEGAKNFNAVRRNRNFFI
jgi:hypothetical protein